MITHLFIDWHHTLSTDTFWFPWNNVAHPHHKLLEPLQRILFVEKKELLNDWMRGLHSSESVCEILGEILTVDTSIIFEGLKESCKLITFAHNDIPKLLVAIRKKGIHTILATDNMDTFVRFTIHGLEAEKLFDGYLISSEIGHLKSDQDTQGSRPFFASYQHQLKNSAFIDDCAHKFIDLKENGLVLHQVRSTAETVDILKNYAS